MPNYLSNLNVGDGVEFLTYKGETIEWYVADKNYSAYPSNSVTLISKYVEAMLPKDAKETYNAKDSTYKTTGNPSEYLSNLHTWYNSRKSAGSWYAATHSADRSPSPANVESDAYNNWPGFLSEASNEEYALLVPTTRTVGINTGKVSYTARIWNLDSGESGVGTFASNRDLYNVTDYTALELMKMDGYRKGVASARCASYTSNSSVKAGSRVPWQLSTACYYATGYYLTIMSDSGTCQKSTPCVSHGIRPACNLKGDTVVSSSVNDNGNYVVLTIYAPDTPSTIYAPSDVRGGEESTVTWSKSSVVTGMTAGYYLQVKYGDGDWTQLYAGVGTSWTGTVPYGTAKVQYRVCAYNYAEPDLMSDWTYSTIAYPFNNIPPVIDADTDGLGTFSTTPCEWDYTITDEDNDTVTVTRYLDGNEVGSETAVLGGVATFTFSPLEWLKILNGTHKLTVTADDGKESVSKSTTFVKDVSKLVFQNATPVPATEPPTELICYVSGEIPDDVKTYKVEACNNAYDASPVWEDITDITESSEIYNFTNTTKTSDNWGVCVRVTVERGETEGYISYVLFNFLAGNSSTSARTTSKGGNVTYTTTEDTNGGLVMTITEVDD